MKKTTTLFLITVLSLVGCRNPVKEADKYFEEQLNGSIDHEVNTFCTTIVFLYYDNISKYWYSEETTYQDILDDKYKEGYKGLVQLENNVQLIPSDEAIVSNTILELLKQIKIAKEDIKKKQNDIETANSLFIGSGGVSGLLTLGKLLSTKEEEIRLEKKRRDMPENVQVAFDNLTEVLTERQKYFAHKINEMENEAFIQTTPTIEEKKEIRDNLIALMKDKIRKRFQGSDLWYSTDMIKALFDYYEKEFKLSENNNISRYSYTGIPKEYYDTIFYDDFSKVSKDLNFMINSKEYSNGYLTFEDGWVTKTINEISEKTNFEIEAKFRYDGGQIYKINSLVWGKKQGSEFAYGFSGSCNLSDEFKIVKKIEAKNSNSEREYVILYEGKGIYKPGGNLTYGYSPEDEDKLLHRDNTLTIRNIDGFLYFFYNGNFVYKTPTEVFFGNEFGLYAGAASSIAVDYIKVSKLNLPTNK